MALVNTINEFENAHQKKETKRITFWDICRAADSNLRPTVLR
jgi:hypothetical protein